MFTYNTNSSVTSKLFLASTVTPNTHSLQPVLNPVTEHFESISALLKLRNFHPFSSTLPTTHSSPSTTMPFYRAALPQDMTNTLFRNPSSLLSTRRNYGAGAQEDADARLLEEVVARRQQARARAPKPLDREQLVREELAETNKELDEARRRREFLEKELEEAKIAENALVRKKGCIIERIKNIIKLKKESTQKERKREAALNQKEKDLGARPVGVRKVVQAAKGPAKFSGFRLGKKEDM